MRIVPPPAARILVALLLLSAGLLAHAASPIENHPPVAPAPEHHAKAHEIAEAVEGRVLLVTDTRSMAPAITAEDLLVLVPADLEALELGDVIVFLRRPPVARLRSIIPVPRAPKVLIGHRVVEIHRRYVRTRGDALEGVDPERVTQALLVGRVEYAVNGQSGAVRAFRPSDAPTAASIQWAPAP